MPGVKRPCSNQRWVRDTQGDSLIARAGLAADSPTRYRPNRQRCSAHDRYGMHGRQDSYRQNDLLDLPMLNDPHP
jgi:hypothetical protein